MLLTAVTGTALGAAQAPGAPTLEVEVIAQVLRDGDERVEMVIDDGGVLRSGDGLQLRLRASADAYVYVVAYGASGRIQLLRPFSGESREARLLGGVQEIFPAEDVFLPLDGVTGRETLFLMVSQEPVRNLRSLLRRAQDASGVEGAYAELLAARPETLRMDIRHIDRAPLIGLEFAGAAKVSAPLPESDVPTSRAGRGGVASVPLAPAYQADPSLERGGWLGSYEEEGVLSSVGSRVPGVDPPPTVVLPAAVAEPPSPGKDAGRGKSWRERVGQWVGRTPRDEAGALGRQDAEAAPAAEGVASPPARGGDS